MKKLYRFFWDCGRGGDLEGIFIAEEEEVKKIIGKHVYFGEVLGKHSEIFGTIVEGEIEECNVLDEIVEYLYSVFGSTISGYNPLNHSREEEEEESNENN